MTLNAAELVASLTHAIARQQLEGMEWGVGDTDLHLAVTGIWHSRIDATVLDVTGSTHEPVAKVTIRIEVAS